MKYSLIYFFILVMNFASSSLASAAEGDLLWAYTWNPEPTFTTGILNTLLADVASAAYVDGTGAYFIGAGDGTTFMASQLGMQKRDLTTGALIWQRNDPPTTGASTVRNTVKMTGDGASSIYLAGDVYLGGFVAWGIQKRDSVTGNLIWELIMNPGGGYYDTVGEVKYYGSALYIAGEDEDFGASYSRLQKLSPVDGSIIFDKVYNTYPCAFAGGIADMDIDSTGIYTVSYRDNCVPPNSAITPYVEKFNFDGSVAWAVSDGSGAGHFPTSIAVDDNLIYVGGYTINCPGSVGYFLHKRNKSGVLLGSAGNSLSCPTYPMLPVIDSIGDMDLFNNNLYLTRINSGFISLEKRSDINTIEWSVPTNGYQNTFTYPARFFLHEDGANSSIYLGAGQYIGAAPCWGCTYSMQWSMEKRGIAPTNSAPSIPTVTGPIVGDAGTTYTFTASSSDPDGDTLRYGFDWDFDANIDVWVPSSGYVNSGTPQSETYSWPTTGTKNFKVLAEDSLGNRSLFVFGAITISDNPRLIICPSPSTLDIGDTINLRAHYWSNYATVPDCFTAGYSLETNNATWSSDSVPVATVTDSGTKGITTAIAAGSATVSATYSGLTATTPISVILPAPSIIITPVQDLIRSDGTAEFDLEIRSEYDLTCTLYGSASSPIVFYHTASAVPTFSNYTTRPLRSAQMIQVDCFVTSTPAVTGTAQARINVIPRIEEL